MFKTYIIQDDLNDIGEKNITTFFKHCYNYSEDVFNQLLWLPNPIVDSNEVVRCYYCDHRVSKKYIQKARKRKPHNCQCECNSHQNAIVWDGGRFEGCIIGRCAGRNMCVQCVEVCKKNHGNIKKHSRPQGKTSGDARCHYCDLLLSENDEGNMCTECKKIDEHDERLNNARKNPQNASNKPPTELQERLYIALRKRGLEPEIEYKVKYPGREKHIDIALPHHHIYIEVNGIQHASKEKQQRSDLWRTYFAAVNENVLTLNVFNLAMDDSEDFHNTVTNIVNIAIEHKDYRQKKKD